MATAAASRHFTKLQALQRGRFTRREFAELRDFSREQESFQQATRRRQIRIWRNEQELYFLQHTNGADLERVRAFQQQHSARLIQRAWRTATQSVAAPRVDNAVDIDPSDRIYTFDLFGFASTDAKAQGVRFNQWRRDEKNVDSSQPSLSLFLTQDELQASASASTPPSPDDEAFVSRRKKIQERIKRKAAQEKAKVESSPKQNSCSATDGAKTTVNRRRELYEKVVAMKLATAERVLSRERGARLSRPQRDLLSAQLIASCENRLKHLRSESPEQMTPSKENNQQGVGETESWDPARRIPAWNHHRRAVCSVLNRQHWWQTQLAGDERDIRRVVVAKSPWEDENNIWIWPRNGSGNYKENEFMSDDAESSGSSCSNSVWPSHEIQRFLVGDVGAESQAKPIQPVSDDEASEWWRAHCTQSHLITNGALVIDKPYRAEFSNNVTNEGDIFPVCTPEVVANRDLYELKQRAKRAARTKSLEQDIKQRTHALTAQVGRRVHDIEAQVEANTQLALEIVQRKEEQRARITREQQATMTIQRYARGMQGRKCAREQRAEFFVMVRGRAIRRGRCEECGDQRAVLECQQCEESLHFCPICWVHVHSTRRRKTHIAIPMTTVVAPLPVTKAASPALAKPTSNIRTVSVAECTGPRFRSLPSPAKQNTTRSAEPAPANSKDRDNKPAEHATQSGAAAPKKAIPELIEACALARRVRAEITDVPPPTKNVSLTHAQNLDATAETTSTPAEYAENLSNEGESARDEVDFSSAVDGDGAMVSETDLGVGEQEVPVETAPKSVQLPEIGPEVIASERISGVGPEEQSRDHALISDTSTSLGSSNIDAPPAESEQSTAEINSAVTAKKNDTPNTDQCARSTAEEDANARALSGSTIDTVVAESVPRNKTAEPSPKDEPHEVAATTGKTSDTGVLDLVESASRIKQPEPNESHQVAAISELASVADPVDVAEVSTRADTPGESCNYK
ncbi:hypothetical protein ON010_g12342 [Phytophthora cinnamomi]|nr:hypothetical protein ON010_g12342 [Phytophthora cinnamomi]